MKNKKLQIFSLILILTIGILVLYRYNSNRFVPKRQNEDQVIVYQDSNKVELFFHNPSDSTPVEIRVEFYVGDGPYEVARAQVQPNETVTILETTDGEPYNHFVPGVYGGRILVYDLETGRLKERINPLEFRIYHSYRDAYDTLVPPVESDREVILDEEEYRPEYLKMRVDLKTEEIRTGIYGLASEWRELKTFIYVEINGEEILIAKADRVPPRTLIFDLYLEPGVADLLREGSVIPNAHVDSYYVDTGEFYDSIPAEIYEIVRSN